MRSRLRHQSAEHGLLSSLQVRLFVELYTTEVQALNFKILTADSQEVVDAGKEGLTKGLKVSALPHCSEHLEDEGGGVKWPDWMDWAVSSSLCMLY